MFFFLFRKFAKGYSILDLFQIISDIYKKIIKLKRKKQKRTRRRLSLKCRSCRGEAYESASVTILLIFLFILYSTLHHPPPLRFHCVGGFWDRTKDSGIEQRMLGCCCIICSLMYVTYLFCFLTKSKSNFF